MDRYCLLFLFILCLFNEVLSQNADKIIGFYYVTDPFTKEESQVQVYKANDNTYSGRVVWVKKEEGRKFEGLEFLNSLKYDDKNNEWINGRIQYPGKNGIFDTYMVFISEQELKVRGYWVFALLGKTVYWKKEEQKRTHK